MVSLARCEKDLTALEPSWSALAQSAPLATPFQSPEWLLPWWRQFGTGRPVVAAVHAGEQLVGLLACTVLDEPPQRKLLPMGAGISDYLDALLAPDAPPGCVDLLLQAVLEGAGNVTSCDFADLPPGAALRDVAAPPGWRMEAGVGSPCPVLALPAAAGDLRHAIPAGIHRKLRMNRHRAERSGGWTHEFGDTDLADRLDALARLHGARWDARGEPGGVFADPRVLVFIKEAAPGLQRSGILRLHGLRFGTDLVACCMALKSAQGRLLLYLSGFDQAHAFRSPGTILLGGIIENAIADGCREIDFLRGGESYKHAWGAIDRFNAVRRLVPA